MTDNVFTIRRGKLANSLNSGEIAMVFSAETPHGISTLTQNKNFLYLTGLQEVCEAVYICSKVQDKANEMLFIQRNIPERIVWDGEKMYPAQATEISGINIVKYRDEFYDTLPAFLSTGKKVYANYGISDVGKPLNNVLFNTKKMQDRFPHLSFDDISELITPLRQIKDETEITKMTRAIEITGLGLDSIFHIATADMFEYELEAMLFFEMRRRGLTAYGFAPIIAAGVNATTLHYIQNNTKIREDELVLCDVGADFEGYSADITRTFPISGKFTQRQADVYTEVLACQKSIISMIAPGVAMADLNAKAAELLGNSCVKLGLITDPADYKKHYMHSIGHQLGLDTHDIGPRNAILQPGMVITVEPGIYIKEEGIGIRIEDDILVTASGCTNLSHMIPKEIDEIEAIRE